MAMTPRERIIATLNHEKPDRVPIMMGCRPEVMARLREHYGVGTDRQVEQILEADMTRGARVTRRMPQFEQRLAAQPADALGWTGQANLIWHDDMTFEDLLGVVQRYGSDRKYVEWVSGPFVDSDDLDSFPWPEGDECVADADLAEQVAQYKEAGYWVIGTGQLHPFKMAWHMRGFENFLCDYLANPAWVEEIYRRLVAYNLPICRALAAAGVDQISFWGDVAMQDRMIVPPDKWRSLDKPVWKTIIDETRKVNPDVRFFFHSDGNTEPIIDDIIEVGFDFLNPLQPECVNPASIKARWGDRICLDGGGSIQRTLPRGTLDDVRREVDFLMTTCAYDGGYTLRASNVVPFDCPTENVVAFYELARDYDMSKLTGPPAEIPDPPCLSIRP